MSEMPTNLRFSERMAWEAEQPTREQVQALLWRVSRLRAELEEVDEWLGRIPARTARLHNIPGQATTETVPLAADDPRFQSAWVSTSRADISSNEDHK